MRRILSVDIAYVQLPGSCDGGGYGRRSALSPHRADQRQGALDVAEADVRSESQVSRIVLHDAIMRMAQLGPGHRSIAEEYEPGVWEVRIPILSGAHLEVASPRRKLFVPRGSKLQPPRGDAFPRTHAHLCRIYQWIYFISRNLD